MGPEDPSNLKKNTHHFFKPNYGKLQNDSKNVSHKIGSKRPRKLGPILVSESGLFFTLGSGTSRARNKNLRPLLNRNIPLISAKYGLRNHFQSLESVFLMKKSENKGPNFWGPLLLILRLTFLEVFCNFRQFGLKKNGYFFYWTGLQDPCVPWQMVSAFPSFLQLTNGNQWWGNSACLTILMVHLKIQLPRQFESRMGAKRPPWRHPCCWVGHSD